MKQKRYCTAEEILAAIEMGKRKIAELTKEADLLDSDRDHWDQFNKDAAFKKRRSADRIANDKIPKLRRLLAEIMTPEFPGMGGDGSVTA